MSPSAPGRDRAGDPTAARVGLVAKPVRPEPASVRAAAPPAHGSAANERVERFGKTVRWFHWTFALSFLCLAATGGLLGLRQPLGVGAEAARRILRAHEVAALCLLVVPTLVVLSGSTREFFRELAPLAHWSRDDLRWLALQPLSFVKSVELPRAGKLNPGQKVNALAMAGLAFVLTVSGGALYLHPGALLPLAVHVACFLVWIPLFAGHLCLALLMPGTRPALRGMINGRVDREWARHHHPRWIEELEAGSPAPPRR